MSMFAQRFRNIEMAASPDDGDGVKFVLGRFGEDAGLIRSAFHAENQNGDCSVIVFTHDQKPRRELCSHASLSAAMPLIEAWIKAMPDNTARKAEAVFWVGLCESASASCGRALLKLAGLG